MELYTIIVEDKNGKLYELDSPYYNENFSYDETYDTLKEIVTNDMAMELSNALSKLKFMGISNKIVKQEVLNGSEPLNKVTVEFYYYDDDYVR